MSPSLPRISSNKLFFLADYDGAISRAFGAAEMPRTIVLDPMLRAIADIAWDIRRDTPRPSATCCAACLRSTTPRGVPMFAPALIVPRVFSFELCDFLMQFYEQQGGMDSGFQFDIAGKTTTLSDWRLKRRSDVVRWRRPRCAIWSAARSCGGCLPEIERYFQFKATRMDRYIVACYDSEVGGHFHRHRDNVNAGAQHRRFARLDQSQQRFRGLRPDVSGIRPQGLPAAGRRRAGVLLRRAASGDAGHPRPALCLPGVPLRRGRRARSAKPTTPGCMPASGNISQTTTGCFRRRPRPKPCWRRPSPQRAALPGIRVPAVTHGPADRSRSYQIPARRGLLELPRRSNSAGL